MSEYPTLQQTRQACQSRIAGSRHLLFAAIRESLVVALLAIPWIPLVCVALDRLA